MHIILKYNKEVEKKMHKTGKTPDMCQDNIDYSPSLKTSNYI